MTRLKPLLLGALAYALVTFPLAYWWHLVGFGDAYERLNYVTLAEPRVPVGFATIVFQGFLLSAVFPFFRGSGSPLVNGLRFSFVAGLFFWSGVVVAHLAKHDVGSAGTFLALETAYFALHFGLFGLALGLIHARLHALAPARA